MDDKVSAKLYLSDIAIWGFVLLVAYYFLFNFFGRTQFATTFTGALTALRYIALVLLVLSVLRGLLSDYSARKFIVCFILSSLVVVGLTMIFHPEITQFSDTVSTFFSTVLQLALLVYLVDDIEKLIKALRVFSIIAAFLLLYFLFINGITYNSGRYSMALGYVSLVPAMTLYYSFFKKRHLIDIIGAVVITATIFTFGSRGPLLCLGIYLILTMLKNTKPQYMIFAFIILFVLYLFYNQILSFIISLFSSSSTSRTLQYILSGQISEDSGRYIKYAKVLDELKKNPLKIRGINSDYLLIGKYTHNIFLELLYEFGCVLGGIVCVDLIYRIIITLIHSTDSIETEFCFMFMCISIPQLLVSHSLWAEWTFWVWFVLYIKFFGHGLVQALITSIRKRRY